MDLFRVFGRVGVDTSDLKRDLDKAVDQADKAGKEIVKDSERNMDGFKQAAAAGGAAAGVAVSAALLDTMNREAGSDKLAASLGLSPEESKRVASVSADIYKNAWGGSTEEVNAALKGVIQNIDGMGSASDEVLQNTTQQAMALAQTFDQDVGGVTAAVSQLLRTGVAKNAQEAMDIITVGMQNGANKSDDLLETINEYSTQWRKVGIDGPTAMGMISQAIKAGARDSDVAADAIKEFTLRTQQSTATLNKMTGEYTISQVGEAYTKAGFQVLDASGKMATGVGSAAWAQDQLAKGGQGARDVMSQLITTMREMPPGAEKAALSTALLGTQAEDLGDALYAMDPTTAAQGLGEVDGAAQEVATTIGDNTLTAIEGYKRGMQDLGVELVGHTGKWGSMAIAAASFAPAVLSVLGPMAQITTAMQGLTLAKIKDTAATAGNTIATGANAVAQGIAKVATLAWNGVKMVATALQWAWNVALTANPIGVIIMAIAAVIAIVVVMYKRFDWFREAVQKVWEVMKVVWGWAVTYIKFVLSVYKRVFEAIIAVVRWVWNAYKRYFGFILDVIRKVIDWVRENWRKLVPFLLGPVGLAVKWIVQHWGRIKDTFARAIDFLKEKVKGIVTPFRNAFQKVVSIVKGAVNGIISAWNAVDVKVSASVPEWVPKYGGNKFEVSDVFPDIPLLANGGIATGPTLAMVGEGAEPEAIVPLSKANAMGFGGGPSVGHITVNIGTDRAGSPAEVKGATRDGVLEALTQVAAGLRYGGAY
jgi:phage-related minor tail protein